MVGYATIGYLGTRGAHHRNDALGNLAGGPQVRLAIGRSYAGSHSIRIHASLCSGHRTQFQQLRWRQGLGRGSVERTIGSCRARHPRHDKWPGHNGGLARLRGKATLPRPAALV